MDGARDAWSLRTRSTGVLRTVERLPAICLLDPPHLHTDAARIHIDTVGELEYSSLAVRSAAADMEELPATFDIGAEYILPRRMAAGGHVEPDRLDPHQASDMAGRLSVILLLRRHRSRMSMDLVRAAQAWSTVAKYMEEKPRR